MSNQASIRKPPSAIIIMGVAGCGKSTAGEMLGERLGWPFRDADSFHPEANVAKMSAGTPLTDEDRWPWLQSIANWIEHQTGKGGTAIVTCSALKRVYREILIGERTHVQLVHLVGTREVIAARMAARINHFMPTSLLDSQFATLEPPGDDEHPLRVPIMLSPDEVIDHIVTELGLAVPGVQHAKKA